MNQYVLRQLKPYKSEGSCTSVHCRPWPLELQAEGSEALVQARAGIDRHGGALARYLFGRFGPAMTLA